MAQQCAKVGSVPERDGAQASTQRECSNTFNSESFRQTSSKLDVPNSWFAD